MAEFTVEFYLKNKSDIELLNFLHEALEESFVKGLTTEGAVVELVKKYALLGFKSQTANENLL